MNRICFVLGLLMSLGVVGCPTDPGPGGPNPTGGSGPGGGTPDLKDTDGDGISDSDEGAADNRDTDGDKTPDFEDEDSDNDGISDKEEAGDDDLSTPPVDTDGDGTPDYIDTDSDDNGILDEDEGSTDTDMDGKGDWIDFDNDGDGIEDAVEIQSDPANPADTDMDGTPDHMDLDSDDDTIADKDEGAIDPDMDGTPSYLDDDSDEDCVPDAMEAGDSDIATPPVDTDADGKPDFHDRDSDGDGLSDGAEDINCNGVQDGGESSAKDEDSDDDGVSDLIENAAGTDPNDDMDNPQANGDFVFIVPYQEEPTPKDDDLDFSTNLQKVDVYVLVDRSGSMSAELNSIKNNIQTVAANVTCPKPPAMPTPGCIPDIWWGVGTVGYAGSNGDPYTNHLDLQPDPALISSNILTNEPPGCCAEPLLLATWSTVTGQTAAAANCTVQDPYPARTDCTGSPAGVKGIGYPCFRPDALPIIMLTTDESPTNGSNTLKCPSEAEVVTQTTNTNTRVLGIMGDGAQGPLQSDLESLATQTGAVDSNNNNAPLVFAGGGANAATAIENAIKLLAAGVPLDLSAIATDDDSDMVDAVAAFIDHLETQQLGTAECSDGLTDADTNMDSFPDEYLAVTAGTPVCWTVVAKQNTTVMPTAEPQLFQSTIDVYGDKITVLDSRDVYFLVPPEIGEIEIPK